MAAKGPPKDESVLQAVVIADNYHPCAELLGKSWALLPMAGGKAIDYTFEFLLETRVDEVIIYSVEESQDVEKHINDNWIVPGVPFRVTFLSSKHCNSIGEALREIDSKALIQGDFLLLQAGVVSNSDLSAALAAHKARRLKDKNAVLTLIYAECGVNHPARSREFDSFLVVQTDTGRLIYYKPFDRTQIEFELPIEVLLANDNLTTRFDLLDCNVAICSPQIPPLFSDNFDFETRRHLIRDILINEEILGYKIYIHVLKDQYAAFVGDFHSYVVVNQNLLERRCYPTAPDTLNGNESLSARFSWRWPNIYIASGVKRIANNVRLLENVIIGKNCEIGENVTLVNSVIGENCVIQSNTVIENSILWRNVGIDSHCIIKGSLLCDNVRLGSEVRVAERTVIGSNVQIPTKTSLPPGTTLCSRAAAEDEKFLSKASGFSPKAFLWRLEDDENNETDHESNEIWPSPVRLDLIVRPTGLLDKSGSDSSGETSDDEELDMPKGSSGLVSDAPDNEYEPFSREVLDSLIRGFEEKVDCANLIMEINSSKHAYNVPVAELQRRVLTAVLQVGDDYFSKQPHSNNGPAKTETSAEFLKIYKQVLTHFLPLLRNYLKPLNSAKGDSTTAQLNWLAAVRDFAASNQNFTNTLSQVLVYLYNEDVFEENALLSWHETLDTTLKNKLQSFIQWLREAEEESSDSD